MIEQFISSNNLPPTFFLGLIPLPFILTLNTIAFFKLRQVRKLSHHHKLKMPPIYRRGLFVNTISFLIFLTPAITEMKIFVTHPKWFYFYMISGMLAIIGQTMVIRGLNAEIVQLLNRRKRTKSVTKKLPKRTVGYRQKARLT